MLRLCRLKNAKNRNILVPTNSIVVDSKASTLGLLFSDGDLGQVLESHWVPRSSFFKWRRAGIKMQFCYFPKPCPARKVLLDQRNFYVFA